MNREEKTPCPAPSTHPRSTECVRVPCANVTEQHRLEGEINRHWTWVEVECRENMSGRDAGLRVDSGGSGQGGPTKNSALRGAEEIFEGNRRTGGLVPGFFGQLQQRVLHEERLRARESGETKGHPVDTGPSRRAHGASGGNGGGNGGRWTCQ